METGKIRIDMGFPKPSAEYSGLKAITEPMGLVYGPISSRRLGLSLGVNLLGDKKICSYDCSYCELGPTENRMNELKQSEFFPTVAQIGESLRVKLREVTQESIALNNITISGNGEPTLHPEFDQCVDAILAARSDLVPEVPVVILTNGAHCDSRRVVQSLNLLNERIVKVDAGGDLVLKQFNRPLIRANVSKLTAGIRKLDNVIVQSLFVKGAYDNTKNEVLEEWMETIGIIKPKLVQIYTIARIPAESGIIKADEDTLYTIESRLKRKLQIDCAVYP